MARGGLRRRWPAGEKVRIVAASYASDEPISAVAGRYGLNPNQLYTWRRRLSAPGEAGSPVTSPSNGFVPVVVAPPLPPSPYATAPMTVVEVMLGAATVRVDARLDASGLDRVFDAVRRLA